MYIWKRCFMYSLLTDIDLSKVPSKIDEIFAVSNLPKMFNLQKAPITKRSVRLEVQLSLCSWWTAMIHLPCVDLPTSQSACLYWRLKFTFLQWTTGKKKIQKSSHFPQSGCALARSVWNLYKINSLQKSTGHQTVCFLSLMP